MKIELGKTLNVSLTFSRGTDKKWSLEVKDEDSRITVLALDLDDGQFSNLMSTREAKASAVFSTNPKIGKTRESKEITLALKGRADLPRAIDQYNAENAKAEGWFIGEYERNWNSHRATYLKEGGYNYLVVVSRHV